MRRPPILLVLALAATTAGAQNPPQRPLPLGLMGMRLGQARSALPDSTACTADSSGGEWCRPMPYQHMLFRDSVLVALEVPINFVAPDSISADTVWARYALTRALRMLGTPDSGRAEEGRHTLWWNWDGRAGPRRARVIGAPEPDTLGTRVSTVFHLACSPGVPMAECAPPGSPMRPR